MGQVEIPQGVDYSRFSGSYGDEAKNYSIDRTVFNQGTLKHLKQMAGLYPEQTSVFAILQTELDNRLPVRPINENDQSRDFVYDVESPGGFGFAEVFNIIGSFPATAEQYQLLRHFLFQPDLDVRHAAARVIDRRGSQYDKAIQEEFETIIKNDPDPDGRLHYWISESREYNEKNGFSPRITFLQDIPVKVQAPDPRVTEADLRTYFAIGKFNFFEPKAAQDKVSKDMTLKLTQEQIEIMRQLGNLKQRGELTEAQEVEGRNQFDELEMQMQEAEHSIPYVGNMLGQLWRLNQKEVVRAVSAVINNPDRFVTRIFQDTVPIIEKGILASTFIGDQAAQKVFLDSVLASSENRNNPILVTALARSSYDLPVAYIANEILPLVSQHKDYHGSPSVRAARSLCYAITRDIGKERVPKPQPQKLPFFGF